MYCKLVDYMIVFPKVAVENIMTTFFFEGCEHVAQTNGS